MSTSTRRLLAASVAVALCTIAGGAIAQTSPYGFGKTATVAELAMFFSPLPDGRGLPSGSGSVAQGRSVYQSQCVACHGANLQGGLGDRLIGGRGTLINADPTKAPVKTVESYWPYATTLFDYVKRAMPLMTPGSLSNDQVYAVCAFILSEAKIVPSDAVMDAKTLPEVLMPNRDGFIADRRPEQFTPVRSTTHQSLGIATPATTK
ncbi:MAG: cytochrome c [Pseudomonadota bacterium]|nr:cytochrome c [Pseudomonadota bacterium]